VLVEIATRDASQALRTRAAAALSAFDDGSVAPALVASYSSQTPLVRRSILDTLVARPGSALVLVEGIQAGQVARAELSPSHEAVVRRHKDAKLASLVQAVLTTTQNAERKQVLETYRAALDTDADPRAGRVLFRKHCAGCHRIGDVGVNVAPDISDSRVKTHEQLLVDVLSPNQAIDNNYVSYTVVTTSGLVHTGILAAETASSITLRQQDDKSVDVLRADIESIASSGASLMPEGFEKHLSTREMAEVISFVKNWRYLEQEVPGTIGAAGKQ
jgi:putative heme-binding domain-containing protein